MSLRVLCVFAFLLACGLPARASEEINFDAADAYQKWLGTEKIIYMYQGTILENAASYAFKNMTKDVPESKWKIEKCTSYYQQRSFPKGVGDVQISQKPTQHSKILVNGVCFVYKASDKKQRLVVSVSQQSVSFVHADNKESLALSEEMRADLKKEIFEKSIYKASVLEFKENGLVGFLQGVDSTKVMTWDAFILEASLKTKIIDSMDGFLKNYDYKKWKEYGLPLKRGVLLYGPPGTGKSVIGKVLASQVLTGTYGQPVTYIHVQARHVIQKSAIRDVYQIARLFNPAVVFIEDIDLIAGTDRETRQDVKNELMQQLSGIEALEGVLTVATTNLGDKIDDALKRSERLGFHYGILLPAAAERQSLLKLFTRKVVDDGLRFQDYVGLTETWSGADIKQLCDMAMQLALKSNSYDVTRSKLVLRDEHMRLALKQKTSTRLPDEGK